jgi:hypothetical protein
MTPKTEQFGPDSGPYKQGCECNRLSTLSTGTL